MANNAFLRTLTMDGSTWLRASEESLILNVTIQTGFAASTIQCRIGDGPAQDWPTGTTCRFEGVDVAAFWFQGPSGTKVVIAGNSR